MELVITASRSGVVRRVAVEPGQQVERGMRLLELAPEGDTGGVMTGLVMRGYRSSGESAYIRAHS